MRCVKVLSIASLALAVACSGGKGGTFAVRTPKGKATPGVTSNTQPVARGRLAPPSPPRLFAGTNSGLGELLHYCKGASCEDTPTRSLTYVVERSGQITTFAIGAAPVAAHAEVRVRPSDQPSTVDLNPGTLMVFDHGLSPGRYLIDLVVQWPTSSARWRFGLKIAA